MKQNFENEKYLVRTPIYNYPKGNNGPQDPSMTYLSSSQIPGVKYYLELKWVRKLPEPCADNIELVHDYDEIIIQWGADPVHPQTLGAEIEYSLGGQPIKIDTTSGIFIPKGVPHGPMIWKKPDRPHVQMVLKLGVGENIKGTPADKSKPVPGFTELKNRGSDYEQYIIRSPMREAGAEFLRGRTAPTMTYMSGAQVPGNKCYIEFGWTFDMPLSQRAGSGMPVMLHRNFDEIVVHFGGDPDHPEELGGEIEFCVDGQPLRFNTSTVLFVTKGLYHGPLACLKYEKPHIVMAIMAGIGALSEGYNEVSKPDAAAK
jgi:hypothetical protein